jgi:PucR C-terminal helix-turn-helix domain/GAF domain/GGDEF-like domain
MTTESTAVCTAKVVNEKEAMNDLLTADELADRQRDGSLHNARVYAEYHRLAAEQAALRRVATLVARGVEPLEVFDAVTNEMRRCLHAATAGLWRYDTTGEITLVSAAYLPDAAMKWPVGTRTPIEGNTLAAVVQGTGRPARMDTYDNAAGTLAERVRAVGVPAAVGVPVIVDGRVWGLAAVGSHRPGPMPADTEVRISGFAELVASALVAGYRDEQKRQLFGEASQRPLLIDSLLEGRVRDHWSLWEVASNLRLPSNGPFVVVAADVSAGGTEALPDIESKLRSLDVHSAWRLLPDAQVGIVHVNSDQQFDKILALVSRMAAGRVGVSARFGDLRDTPQALHFAKVMMRGQTNRSSPVAVFDGSILATAAVSAPEMMLKSAGTALNRFSDLPEQEREMLFDTFRVWQESDASVNAVAAQLFCHPNTVRHRLRRIEKHTGRSLSRPRDVAELCLAFEVHRRFI